MHTKISAVSNHYSMRVIVIENYVAIVVVEARRKPKREVAVMCKILFKLNANLVSRDDAAKLLTT
jgi:hypothetical protein